MFNKDKFFEFLNAYKDSFRERWSVEKLKWIAVKQFQENWDIDASDFLGMVTTATKKIGPLLNSSGALKLGMILDFIKTEPETVREMFRKLFDEKSVLSNRIDTFQKDAETLLEKYKSVRPDWKHDFQDTNSATTFLWLHFPNKYYLYKYTECAKLSEALENDFHPVANGKTENVISAFDFYDKIRGLLLEDEKIRELLSSTLTNDCYKDESLHTLTIDFAYFVKKHLEDLENLQLIENYDPSLTKEKWISLLRDPDVFTPHSLQIMKRMLDYGGQATCKQLAETYGEDVNFYNRGSSSLAEQIAKKTKCPIPKGTNKKSKWWPILYLGKDIKNRKEGTFIWKLRPELAEALREVDLSQVQLYAEGVSPKRHFWWLNANPKIWSF